MIVAMFRWIATVETLLICRPRVRRLRQLPFHPLQEPASARHRMVFQAFHSLKMIYKISLWISVTCYKYHISILQNVLHSNCYVNFEKHYFS